MVGYVIQDPDWSKISKENFKVKMYKKTNLNFWRSVLSSITTLLNTWGSL